MSVNRVEVTFMPKTFIVNTRTQSGVRLACICRWSLFAAFWVFMLLRSTAQRLLWSAMWATYPWGYSKNVIQLAQHIKCACAPMSFQAERTFPEKWSDIPQKHFPISVLVSMPGMWAYEQSSMTALLNSSDTGGILVKAWHVHWKIFLFCRG